MISIYVTCKDEDEAEKIAKKLLEKRLIACANISPIKSLYWWKGKINNDEEVAMIMKTKKGKFEEIKNEIKKIHSYEVPCICSWDIKQVNEEYSKWLDEEIG